MLFNRALSGGARVFCPDCLGGIVPYTPDELGVEVDEEGAPVGTEDVQDAEFYVAEQPASEGITEEEFAILQADSNAKNLCLGDVIHGLGGDPNDLRGMTRGQYEAALKFIEQK